MSTIKGQESMVGMSFDFINKEFTLRFISSLVLILILSLIVLFGDLTIKISILILSFGLFYELNSLHKKKKIPIFILILSISLHLYLPKDLYPLDNNFLLNNIFILSNFILLIIFYFNKHLTYYFVVGVLINSLVFSII